MSMRLTFLVLLFSTPSIAGTWSGYLVDSKCYAAEQANANPNETDSAVDSDVERKVRYCAPNAKTKSFAVVKQDWESLQFDPDGNAKALDLVRLTGKKRYFTVVVNGNVEKQTLHVDSLAATK